MELLKQTENGLELDIQGAIAVALEKEQSKDEKFDKRELLKSFDSISEAAEYYNVPDDKMCAAVVVNKKIGGYVKYSEK